MSIPLHLQAAYKNLNHRPGDFLHAETFAARGLSLPMYSELSLEQLRLVESAMTRAVELVVAQRAPHSAGV